jgi:hypothetical protein
MAILFVALADAVVGDDLEEVERIVSQYQSLLNEKLDKCENPALLIASRHNKPAIVAYLIAEGADSNARNKVSFRSDLVSTYPFPC